MIHEILTVGLLQCNCSIFGDEASGDAIVVDPGDNVPDILAVVARHHLRVKAILITHAHIDHIGGADQLRAATGAPVYMHTEDMFLSENLAMQAMFLGLPQTPKNPGIDFPAREGDTLQLGPAEFQILHTPGHTQGSISLWIPAENKLIAGDTLFNGSIGRTDLPGGSMQQILRSIRERLFALPEDAIVIPGHGASTTIGREKQFNPFVGRSAQ